MARAVEVSCSPHLTMRQKLATVCILAARTSTARRGSSVARDYVIKLGTMLFLVDESRWTNQHGDTVRVGQRTSIYH